MAGSQLRKFGKSLIVIVAMMLFACTDSGSEAVDMTDNKVYKWRMVTTWPKNYPGVGLAAENLSRYVEEMSNGRLQIQVYGNGELVPALEVFDAVSRGSVQLGHGASYYWVGKVPSSQFFTALPFGMNAQEMNAWLHYGGGLELWQKAYAPYNLLPLTGGNTGVQMAGWFNKEINSLEDIKNQLINLSKIVKNEWDKIDKQISDLEKEKLEFISTFPDALKELYDNLKKRGLDVIAAYRNDNQCGCCGVDLTSSEIEEILNSKFQQCTYCDGVVI